MGVGCSLHAFEGGVCNIKELGKRQPGLRRGSSRRVERSEEGGSELFLKVSGLGGPRVLLWPSQGTSQSTNLNKQSREEHHMPFVTMCLHLPQLGALQAVLKFYTRG